MLNKRQNRLESTYQQVLSDMEKEQKKYDKDSSHGQTEGVSLDLSIQ
jgi:predicted secreted Zn-dependent protease